MARMRRSRWVAMAATAVLAGCASGSRGGGGAEGIRAPSVTPAPAASGSVATSTSADAPAPVRRRDPEPWPPAGYADEARPAATGEIIELAGTPQGISVLELLELVRARTGAVFLYDEPSNVELKSRLTWIGTFRVPTSRLVDLCRSILAAHSLVLQPVGPESSPQAWLVLHENNPAIKTRPVYLREEQVLGYADCDGLLVCTTFRVRDIVDAMRVRQALTTLTTATANIGRIQDTGNRSILVMDFAPVVASMKRAVDEINRNAVEVPRAPSAPPK